MFTVLIDALQKVTNYGYGHHIQTIETDIHKLTMFLKV